MSKRRRLSARLLFVYAAAFLVTIAALGFVVDQAVRSALIDLMVDELASDARFVAARLGDDPAVSARRLDGIASGARITVIGRDGIVVADTAKSPAAMENHSGRPEVIEALSGSVGVSARVSVTTSESLLYVAVPPLEGQDVLVRLAISEHAVSARLASIRLKVLLATAFAGLLGVGVVALVGGWISAPIRALTERATATAGGDLQVHSIPTGIREVAALGAAFDRMSSNLEERRSAASGARDELEVILGALPVGVVVVERVEDISFANPAAEAMLGARVESMAALMPAPFRRVLAEAAVEGNASASTSLGSPPRTLKVSATLFGDSRILLVMQDTTEAERVDAARRDFVAAASHELKTPVASIRAAAEALELAFDRDRERAIDFTRMISASTFQLSRLVSDLLDLSRLESSEITLEPQDLGEIVCDVTTSFRDLCESASLTLTVDVEPVEVMGSRADLVVAVRNLLDNAVRYSDAGGRVVVRVREADFFGIVEVEDSGSGIPARSIPRVFERFYRVDAARSRAVGGTGLGLAIVKHVVERHGGSVSVISSLGSGSTFSFSIPSRRVGEYRGIPV